MVETINSMIEDVRIKRLKVIHDERGFLMEMLRRDDPIFEDFGQVYITGCKRGVAKGWHYHRKQTDHFVCVSGRALVVLYDNREGSPTKGEVNEFILESPIFNSDNSSDILDINPVESGCILLKIPPLVLHGFTSIDGEETSIINVPTLPYNRKEPDEYRYPWDSKDIPYAWPAFVRKGG